MSLEQQLGNLNANLEKLITLLASKTTAHTSDTRNQPLEEPKQEKPKAEKVKAEVKPEAEAKTEVKETPEPEEKTSNTSNITFDSLADKVKALAKLDREAARAVFTSMKVTGLSGVAEEDYVKLDLALAKALNVAKAAKEEA